MLKLKVEELTVTTFTPEPAAEPQLAVGIETQKLECWSPLCVPTWGASCNCNAAV